MSEEKYRKGEEGEKWSGGREEGREKQKDRREPFNQYP